jgi:HlyD family secretion protein
VAFYSPDKPGRQTEAKPVVTVPASAVRDGGVFVVVGGKAVRRPVKTGSTTSQGIQIEEGLIGGEDLIANPPADLKNGQKIRAKQG